MFAKKIRVIPQDSSYRKQLEYLHARKSAIDTLIESLEQYDRYRGKRSYERKRKSA